MSLRALFERGRARGSTWLPMVYIVPMKLTRAEKNIEYDRASRGFVFHVACTLQRIDRLAR